MSIGPSVVWTSMPKSGSPHHRSWALHAAAEVGVVAAGDLAFHRATVASSAAGGHVDGVGQLARAVGASTIQRGGRRAPCEPASP